MPPSSHRRFVFKQKPPVIICIIIQNLHNCFIDGRCLIQNLIHPPFPVRFSCCSIDFITERPPAQRSNVIPDPRTFSKETGILFDHISRSSFETAPYILSLLYDFCRHRADAGIPAACIRVLNRTSCI